MPASSIAYRALLKIFVIGAHKTGTTSMCSALEILGFRTSHWVHHEELTAMIKAGRYDFPMLQTHDAVGDLPIPVIFRELDAHYPGSRFILTVRDADQWIQSLENRRWWKDREHPIELGEEEKMFYGTSHFDRDTCKAVYEAHNEAVRQYFAGRPDDLLEFRIGSGVGWQELCAFLDRPVPSVPFPHANPRAPSDEPLALRILRSVAARVSVPLRRLRKRLLL